VSRFAVAEYLRLVRFSHTVFALPFALIGAWLAAEGLPSWSRLAWIVVAMVAARSAAMGFNRVVDAELDAHNPRTRDREIPAGRIDRTTASWLTAACALVFVVACAMLNAVALALSPVVLAVLLGYSFTKRFTSLSHFVLGLALGLAPVGAWVAVRGSESLDGILAPVCLGVAVLFWVAGFDIIYACLDVDFDRRYLLHSIPQRLGLRRALRVAAALHGVFVALLVLLAVVAQAGALFPVGVALVAALLMYEHRLVRPDDLSRVNRAFFTVNGAIGLLLLACVLADGILFGVVP